MPDPPLSSLTVSSQVGERDILFKSSRDNVATFRGNWEVAMQSGREAGLSQKNIISCVSREVVPQILCSVDSFRS